MRFYELVFIVRQDATSNQVEAIVQNYTKLVSEFSGKVTKTEFCGLRTIAYPIKKNKKGHYVLLNIAITIDGMKELERQIKINEDIIRHIFVKVEQMDNSPSPLMQQKSYRDTFRPSHDDFDMPLVSEKASEKGKNQSEKELSN